MSDPACVLVDDDGTPYEIERGSDAWRASMEWARFHGLDPMRIPAGSYIERDAAGRRILFEEYVFDGDLVRINEEGDDGVRVDRVEQGEAPPLPFPPEVTRGSARTL